MDDKGQNANLGAPESELNTPLPKEAPNQFVSPYDPPPPPPPTQEVGKQQNLDKPPEGMLPGQNAQMITKETEPKKKSPIFTIIFLLVIIATWAGVAYLAYQNYLQKKSSQNTTVPETLATPTLNPTPVVDTLSDMKVNVVSVLPMRVSLPSTWVLTENANPKLANQKLVTAQSPDFAYEGSTIAKGYEFRIGPVSDLSIKYTTFEKFAAAENKDGGLQEVTINNTRWLKGETSAKTLMGNLPLTITLYTGTAEAEKAAGLFSQILSSISFTNITPSVVPTTQVPTATDSGGI